jgi:uncharacterized membrane protein YagU involved in acid resistance
MSLVTAEPLRNSRANIMGQLRRPDVVGSALAGCVAGLLATVPMTAAMVRLHRRLPQSQRYALPPRIITDGVMSRLPLAGRHVPWDGPRRALAAHFAFGAATGALYGAGTSHESVSAGITTGVAFGIGVWAASYMGWVPLTGLMPPASRQPAQRNVMMAASHIVWGAALGLATLTLRPRHAPQNRAFAERRDFVRRSG